MFDRTKLTLEESKKVADDLNQSSPVLGYLTEHLLVVFVAELESELKLIIKDVLVKNSNSSIANLISEALGNIVRRTKQKDLLETIKYFGNDRKEVFLNNVPEEILARYKNYITNRDDFAHGKSINLTWADVQSITDDGEEVLQALQAAII